MHGVCCRMDGLWQTMHATTGANATVPTHPSQPAGNIARIQDLTSLRPWVAAAGTSDAFATWNEGASLPHSAMLHFRNLAVPWLCWLPSWKTCVAHSRFHLYREVQKVCSSGEAELFARSASKPIRLDLEAVTRLHLGMLHLGRPNKCPNKLGAWEAGSIKIKAWSCSWKPAIRACSSRTNSW